MGEDIYVQQAMVIRGIVEASVSSSVSVDGVTEKSGWTEFALSDGNSFKIKMEVMPIAQVYFDGYWYINGIRSEWRSEDGGREELVASMVGAASAQHTGEPIVEPCVSFIVEGYTDWTFYFTDGASVSLVKTPHAFNYDYVLRGVNHRGYCTVAPENTLPAYRLSRLHGFTFVETDVRFTSDNIPVCIHDASVSRTSNGDGTVKGMTFTQLRDLDFGSWKDSSFVDTKIPTFEEFLSLCNSIDLIPYIELKTGNKEQVETVVSLVDQYGFTGQAVFISFSATILRYVLGFDPYARVGFLTSVVNDNTMKTVGELGSIAINTRCVFIDSSDRSFEAVELCEAAGVPLEIWVLDSTSEILALPSYISGVTSNKVHAGRVISEAGR